jgi:DNA-directed RNA polymerase specialized sigma24 family protein
METLPADVIDASTAEDDRILSVSDALQALSVDSPRQCELVKLRFFAGMTMEEAAKTLNISLASAKRDWASAKVFIYRTVST